MQRWKRHFQLDSQHCREHRPCGAMVLVSLSRLQMLDWILNNFSQNWQFSGDFVTEKAMCFDFCAPGIDYKATFAWRPSPFFIFWRVQFPALPGPNRWTGWASCQVLSHLSLSRICHGQKSAGVYGRPTTLSFTARNAVHFYGVMSAWCLRRWSNNIHEFPGKAQETAMFFEEFYGKAMSLAISCCHHVHLKPVSGTDVDAVNDFLLHDGERAGILLVSGSWFMSSQLLGGGGRNHVFLKPKE